MRRPATALTAAITALVLTITGCVIGLPLLMLAQDPAAGACPAPTGPGTAPPAGTGRWRTVQVAHAAVIVSTGRSKQIPPRGYVIALAVAMQESRLRNLANSSLPESLRLPHDAVGRDHDSVGLFQQRPSAGWGTIAQLMTPGYAAGAFYDRLVTVPGWQQMRLTDAAQAVQRSGTPEAYQQWEPDAEQLAAHVLGLPNIDDVGGGDPAAPCGADELGDVPVGPGGWVQPVRAAVGSPFGMRGGHLHAGVDLDPGRGKPIRAAAVGVVEVMQCQSSIGTCDRDGGIGVAGCGWYVDIRHPGDVVTRYCHMIQRPEVAVGERVRAGQVIGFVGSSGNSSGPHLHFEIHRAVPAGPYHADHRTAVDPEQFMRAAGAPLGP